MESKNSDIPDIIVGRLPRYLRALNKLRLTSNTTNSQELGELLGYSAAQIRKDLSQFGGFGKQGTGYNIDFLISQIKSILNINRSWNILLVGVGNLGRAIINYPGFSDNGFHVVAAVDSNPAIIGTQIGNCTVKNISDIPDIIQIQEIKIAMLTVPASVAQATAEFLVESGIRGILTYAPTILNLPPEIRVEYVDPLISLQHITYYL